MKKINLIVILPSYAGGGAERVIFKFLSYLDKKFIDCTLIVISSLGPLKPTNINYNIVELKCSRLISSIPKLVKTIKLRKPDIILSTFPHITLLLLALKKIFLFDMKLIAREPNMVSFSLKRGIFLRLLRFLHKYLMPNCDKVIVTSKAMYLETIKLGVPDNKINLIRNPVDIELIRKNIKPIRVPGKGIRLVSVGRLVFQKGLDRLIPIIANNINIHLTVVGSGPQLTELKKLVKNYKIENQVNFLGYLECPYSYIAGADYLILPSRWEGLPNVALEALALGIPVISFKEVLGLKDYKINLAQRDIILCHDEEEMRDLLSKLNLNKKNITNPSLKNSLLKMSNTPELYSKEITSLIKEINLER